MKSNPEIMRIMKPLLKSGVFTIVVFIVGNLFLLQKSFGQAGPVKLKGSGGTITEINVGGTVYEVHTYTATVSSTFTPPSGVSSVEYLLVAGGGGGGRSIDRTGGGGGAGGVLSGSYAVNVQVYTVTVGGGGATNTAGSNSMFDILIANGGGRGGQKNSTATSGGSGGGGYHNGSDAGAPGTAGQGTAGGSGYDNASNQFGAGGGGGQSQAGAWGVSGQGGNGGNGYTSLISGTSTVYAGGGGGGYERTGGATGIAGAGGTGGGGAGAYAATDNTSAVGTPGASNTGGGGGGAAGSLNGGGAGGAGGSGIVIIRYKAPTMAVATQPSVIVSGGTNFAQPVVIQLLDANGVAVPGIVVTAAIQSGTGGTLNNNTATTDASGNATFTNLQLSGPAGNAYTLNFKVPGSGTAVVSNTINICVTPLSTITGHSDISCNGSADGSVTVKASGGASPYTFSINNGAYNTGTTADENLYNGLSPNTPYHIQVKDSNGCISK